MQRGITRRESINRCVTKRWSKCGEFLSEFEILLFVILYRSERNFRIYISRYIYGRFVKCCAEGAWRISKGRRFKTIEFFPLPKRILTRPGQFNRRMRGIRDGAQNMVTGTTKVRSKGKSWGYVFGTKL